MLFRLTISVPEMTEVWAFVFLDERYAIYVNIWGTRGKIVQIYRMKRQ